MAEAVDRAKLVELLTIHKSGTMTYHIANVVGFRGNSAPVRRELEKMMREGLVEHAPDNISARQIKWRLVRAAQAAKQGAPNGQ